MHRLLAYEGCCVNRQDEGVYSISAQPRWTRSRRPVACARGELAEMNVRPKGEELMIIEVRAATSRGQYLSCTQRLPPTLA